MLDLLPKVQVFLRGFSAGFASNRSLSQPSQPRSGDIFVEQYFLVITELRRSGILSPINGLKYKKNFSHLQIFRA
jgi:hypothetical protein